MTKSDSSNALYAAIVGEPNVGKSTLLNALVGEKISITTRKPQTTRHRILGVKTQENTQCVFIDTPGLHDLQDKLINRYMNRSALNSMVGVDLILWVVNPFSWSDYNKKIVGRLEKLDIEVILVVNKIDCLSSKEALLPFLHQASAYYDFSEIVPLSALKNDQVDALWHLIKKRSKPQPFFFSESQRTDVSDEFIISERIREQLTIRLGQELPYAISVSVERIESEAKKKSIYATIWVDHDSQKGIVIGKSGQMLKAVGMYARKDLEAFFQVKVYLKLWVKVKKGWRDQKSSLDELGYS